MSAPITLVALGLVALASPAEDTKPARVVSVGGAVTETVFALGGGARVVGVDATSRFPAEVMKLPQVGVHRDLSVEGVLSLSPDLVLVGDDAAPPAALEQLRTAAVRVVVVPRDASVKGVRETVRVVAEALGVKPAGDALLAKLDRRLSQLSTAAPASKPRVAYVYAAGGSFLVAGADTAADAMLTLAGGSNAVQGYTGYRPLSAEALVAAKPDVILFPARALAAVGGVEGILRAPGVALTPAGKSGRVLPVDDALALGFGPRLPEAITVVRSLIVEEARAR